MPRAIEYPAHHNWSKGAKQLTNVIEVVAVRRHASMRLGSGLIGGRRNGNRFAAPAGRRLIWVVEHELGRELVDLVVHLGSQQEQDGGRINDDAHALVIN